MEYKINENLIIEAESENEEFGLISFYHPLTFNPSINDEYIFLDDQDAHCYNHGQIEFEIETRSVQEYLDILSHLVEYGWAYDIQITDKMTWNLLVSGSASKNISKKSLFTVNKIKQIYKKENSLYQILSAGYIICLRMSYNRLNKFRNDIKSIPGYKIVWAIGGDVFKDSKRDKYIIK